MEDESPKEPLVIEIGAKQASGAAIATTSFHTVYNKSINLTKIKKWVETAGIVGARLVVFPEQSLQGYISFAPQGPMPKEQFEYQYENAETVPGPATDELTALAKKYDLFIVVGMTEKSAKYAGGIGSLFNSTALIGSQGVIGVYRKVHLPGNELHIYVRGMGFYVFDTPVGRIGMNICHDKSFPETGRELMINGAEIIVHSTAWAKGNSLSFFGSKVDDYAHYMCDVMERHTAAANEVWFVSSNNFGVDPKTGADFFGHSRIIHPTGIVIADSGEKECIVLVHGLDIRGEILRRRTSYYYGFNFARDRVPSAYSTISKDLRHPAAIPEKGTTESYRG
jgi:predicted amidohydrolase